MRYILALSFILSSFNGYCAAAAGAGGDPRYAASAAGAGGDPRSPASASPLGRTGAVFTPDARHSVVVTAIPSAMPMLPTPRGFGRSADYSHVLPAFKMAAVTEGGVILDLGCGHAPFLAPLMTRKDAPKDAIEYIAIDLDTTAARDTLRAKLIPTPLAIPDDAILDFPHRSTLRFVSMDVLTALQGVEANSVDHILAGHLIHFFKPAQLITFFQETHRVLKPGKKLYLTWADFYSLGLPAAHETHEVYESRYKTMKWPGMLDMLPKEALRQYTIANLNASPTLEVDILKAAREFCADPSLSVRINPEKWAASTIQGIRTKASSAFYFNILKPREMKLLAKELGFSAPEEFLHYIDQYLNGAQSYYGLVLTKTERAIDAPSIAERIAQAEATNLRLLTALEAKGKATTAAAYAKQCLTDGIQQFLAKQAVAKR